MNAVVALCAVLVMTIGASTGAADPESPRLAALVSKQVTEDAFWKRVEAEGTPLVEDVKDPHGRLLVSFLYRGKIDTKHVNAYATPSGASGGYAKLELVPGTRVFATSMLVDPAARFMYFLAPGDSSGPLIGGWGQELAKRMTLFRPDLLNKRPGGQGGSIVELPKAPVQSTLVPKRGTPSGELAVHTVKSKALGNERSVIVYTPPGFVRTGPKYPLVVMFDGPTAVTSLGIPIVLDELIAAKRIPPSVVMLVDNVDRQKELPDNAAFADFVAHDLVAWVRRTYHATSDPASTVVAGISFGGLAALYAAGRHPGVYGNALSQSGSFWWSPEGDVEAEATARAHATRPRSALRVWMECGTFETGSPKRGADQLVSNRHLRDVLVAKGNDVMYREFVGGHEYINWRGSIGDGLIALLNRPSTKAAPAPAKTAVHGRPGGIEVGEAKRTILHVAPRKAILEGGTAAVEMLKKLPPEIVTEIEVNSAGYALMELGHAKAALPLFVWNVQRFPKSGNARDSLGDAQWRLGDKIAAMTSYKRALELDPSNDNAKLMLELLR